MAFVLGMAVGAAIAVGIFLMVCHHCYKTVRAQL